MGAQVFFTTGEGKNATEAFSNAVHNAKYMHGHGGYTGTIAEKHSFVEIDLPNGCDPREFAGKLIDDGDRRVDDKWGPAGCIKLRDDAWLFFGWASS